MCEPLVGRAYAPDRVQSEKYDQLFDIYKDIYPALRDQFTRLRQVTEAIGEGDARR